REEERLAWQRLVRVLGHEINNSLAPHHSISSGLKGAAPEDVEAGLAVIERRAESLMRFMSAYTKLARLPPPQLAPVDVEEWIKRVAALEKRIPVSVRGGPPASVQADADQLEQLLINLIRNAADAALETGGAVEVSWSVGQRQLEISVVPRPPSIGVPFASISFRSPHSLSVPASAIPRRARCSSICCPSRRRWSSASKPSRKPSRPTASTRTSRSSTSTSQTSASGSPRRAGDRTSPGRTRSSTTRA